MSEHDHGARVVSCSECGKPWGAILDARGKPTEENMPTPDEIETWRCELIEVLWEQWECDYEPEELVAVDKARLPAARADRIVYITEATSAFACENLNAEGMEGGYWYPLADAASLGFPAWLTRGRRQRWAVMWYCCDIGGPDYYCPVVAGGTSNG